MNTKSSIFTCGVVAGEIKEKKKKKKKKKKRTYTDKVKFSIPFLPSNCNDSVYAIAPAFRTETQLISWPFCVTFDASSVFTGYLIGCKLATEKNNSKVR